jgi:hypothetical protein
VPRCASAIQIVLPLESIAETQPQLQPALLRLSAMISQYFIRGGTVSLSFSTRQWPSVIARDESSVMNIIRRFEFWLRCPKATDFVWPFLTASSVIAVMPACMLTVPNPGARNEWPAHCDGGIHYVWPFKFAPKLVIVTIAARIPRKQSKAAKQHY